MHPVVAEVTVVVVVVVESVPSSVVPSVEVVDEDSSEVESVCEVESSDLAQEFIFRLKKKISKISINTSFR